MLREVTSDVLADTQRQVSPRTAIGLSIWSAIWPTSLWAKDPNIALVHSVLMGNLTILFIWGVERQLLTDYEIMLFFLGFWYWWLSPSKHFIKQQYICFAKNAFTSVHLSKYACIEMTYDSTVNLLLKMSRHRTSSAFSMLTYKEWKTSRRLTSTPSTSPSSPHLWRSW